jgi:hypothetical protein
LFYPPLRQRANQFAQLRLVHRKYLRN